VLNFSLSTIIGLIMDEISPLVYLCGILALGVLGQWLAWRLRLPAIVLLLVAGFAAGRFANPDDLIEAELLLAFVSLSVAVILFEGGLSLQFHEVRETSRLVVRLVSAGLLTTWGLTAVAAHWLLAFDWPIAVLAGALLTVSGPTVIVPLLRHVRPERRIGSLVKWEGIVNDPIGAVLAALVFDAMLHGGLKGLGDGAASLTLLNLMLTLLLGSVIGGLTAVVMVVALRRHWVPDFLQSAVFLAVVVVVFTLSNQLRHEAGLVSVTALGVALANQRRVTVKHVVEFKENLRVLLIAVLFVLLASRVPLSSLADVGWGGAAFVAALILVVRPVSVWLATLGTEIRPAERLFLCCIHPRGIVAAAVASLFALEIASTTKAAGLSPELVGQAQQLVPVTFLVIIGTVTVYGLSIGPLSRWLELSRSNPQGILFAGASTVVREIALAVQNEGFQVLLVDTNQWNTSRARMAGLATCYANIGSEYVRNELDLGDIGRLLAMTPNDEVNALAALNFAEDFSRAGVYQLATPASSSERTEPLSAHHRGRVLFGEEVTFDLLARRFAAGAEVKASLLTDDYGYDEFVGRYGESAILLFVVEESGNLAVCTAEQPTAPKPGQKVIAVVDV